MKKLFLMVMLGIFTFHQEVLAQATTGYKADLSTFQNILKSLSYFLNYAIMPLLFTIALLVFLVNVARFFILGGASEESRNKAKRLALYSVAAFVFLVSIWGIVNMFVIGLRLNDTTANCPDYLPASWCKSKGGISGNLGFTSGNGTYAGGVSGAGSGSSNGSGSSSGGADNTLDPLNTPSGIAQLVFGTPQDTANLNFTSGAPRAEQSTAIISDTATCNIGLQTLSLASDVEDNQTTYLLYADSNDLYHWQNLTDIHYPNGITYDGDTINNLVAAGAHNLYLIHTHQKRHAEEAGVVLNGFGPSSADMKLMCDSVARDMTHVLVDWGGIWIVDQQVGTCPRTSAEEQTFPIIESLLLLSEIPTGSRNQEFFDLYNSPLLSNQQVRTFDSYKNTNFDSMSNVQVRSLIAPLLSQSRLSIRRDSASNFCNNL